ncbi:MAG: lamin tail domain-containing protein [Methanothrix sp.]|nr:lamin tail domain-containing protein [Methanothrix sp.]
MPAADGRVCIVAALVNPSGPDKGLESVIILNITPKPIDLKGWNLADSEKKKMPLSGIVKAGQTMTLSLPGTGIQLPNEGGIITLLDNKGLKVHGVSYTAKDAAKEGWTIVF